MLPTNPILSSLPVALDLALYAGDGWSCVFTFVDKATGDPWPIDGVWHAHVRAPADNTTLLVEFTVTPNMESGKVTLALSGDQVRTVGTRSDAVWDLQQTDVDAEPRTWFRGRITATQDVTRP